MNDERLLEAVTFLAEKARADSESGKDYQKELSFWSTQLGKMGFSEREVGTALSWILERFGSRGEKRPGPVSFRIFSEAEISFFTAEAFAALVRYYALGIVPLDRLELLLEKVSWAGKAPVDRKNLEWLVSILVFSPAERMMGYPMDPATTAPHTGGVH